MKKWPLIIIMAAIVGLILAFIIGQILPKMRTTSSDIEVNITDPALIKRGQYVARTADCVACHTTLEGETYAGGLPMLTPLGAIYSTNITPDKETGIGQYTFSDFKNAVKHGVRHDNKALYPAMPYPSYQLIPDEDLAAMYAYFMSDVKPVKQANLKSELPPVTNWRWPLAYWQALFDPKRDFVPETDDALLTLGQYLIEGPGHCGSCHTGRGIGFQEIALNNADSEGYLSGGRMPETPHDRMAFTMPEFINLSDADVAEVVNYVRNSWTNQAPEIDVDDVVKMRAFLAKKPKTSTDIAPDLSIDAQTKGAKQ